MLPCIGSTREVPTPFCLDSLFKAIYFNFGTNGGKLRLGDTGFQFVVIGSYFHSG